MTPLALLAITLLSFATQVFAIDKPASSTIQLRKAKILAHPPKEQDDLQRLSNQVSKLEGDVDTLQTSVQMNKQQLVESSKINHTLDISLDFDGMDQIHVKLLDVRLDGFRLFSVNESTGIWTPKKNVSIYSGPIMPGAHEATLTAKVAYLPAGSNTFADNALSHMEETVPFTIDLTQKTQAIVLRLSAENGGLKVEKKMTSTPAEPKPAEIETKHE